MLCGELSLNPRQRYWVLFSVKIFLQRRLEAPVGRLVAGEESNGGAEFQIALSCGSLPVEAGHQTVWHVPDTSPWPVLCLALAK